jgi:O-antigen/teichoic acid export membrane protein
MSATRPQKALAWSVPIFAEAVALGRSILLARFIGADELGQAIVLAVVLRFAEMMSDFGLERLLVQAHDGDEAELQANLQGAALLRAIGLCGLLIVASPLLSAVFPDGPSVFSYMLLALVPLIKGGLHLDYRRAERRFEYSGLAYVETGAAIAMLAGLAVAILAGFQDHRVLLGALLMHACAQVALSHFVAKRNWNVSFQISYLMRIWIFGAPLVVNAGLMFLTLQADRLIVAVAWTWQDVAVYGITAQLAFLPALIFGRAANSLLLPKFSATSVHHQEPMLTQVVSHSAGAGCLFALSFTLVAPKAIGWIYGDEIMPVAALALVFGIAAGARIARTPWSVLAVATARTGDTVRANLIRAAALVPAVACALSGQSIVLFALCAACGEIAAWVAGWWLFKRNNFKEVLV